MVKLGTNLPDHLIGSDPGPLTDFLQGVEELGYHYVTLGDHVLGADVSVRPDWRPYQGKPPLYDHKTAWHEPIVMFGYMAAITRKLELCTGILVCPQRQAALLAKQVAQVDLLTGGRVRLVVAAGWNPVEFEALGVDFAKRGRIMEEQVELMRRLWSEDVVTFHGQYHTVTAAGINPRPKRQIPLWFGGGEVDLVLRRIGRLGDGWFPTYPYFNEERLHRDLDLIYESARAAGRDPATIGIEGKIYFLDPRFEKTPGDKGPPQTLGECVDYAHWWKRFGATHYWVTAPWANLGPEETGLHVPGQKWAGVEGRLRALAEFKEAVGADF